LYFRARDWLLSMSANQFYYSTMHSSALRRPFRIAALCSILVAVFLPLATAVAQPAPQTNAAANRYESRSIHDPDGIGKFYMGREIAQVMGHEAADWLERPSREQQENPSKAVTALGLKPGQVVADIGAGTGYYTRKMAQIVGTNGLVYAVDIQQEMLDLLTNKLAELDIHNVKPVLGTITDPKLPPGSLDLALLVDVYHEFDHPYEMIEAICRALKPEGRLIFVEFRAEDPAVPIKRVHKMSRDQIRKEMSVQPLEWSDPIETLPWQHIFIFRKVAK
jgi:ubiquinone/menaquinone biosynthesis C-methylase UbiE